MSTPSKRKFDYFDISPFESITPTSLRLYNATDESIELGVVHAKKGLFSVRHNSHLYVGQHDMNLGLYDDRCACIDEHVMGRSLSNLLTLFADKTKKSVGTIPREEWKAHFDFKPTRDPGTIRIRLNFFSPFQDHGDCFSFQEEMELHEIQL